MIFEKYACDDLVKLRGCRPRRGTEKGSAQCFMIFNFSRFPYPSTNYATPRPAIHSRNFQSTADDGVSPIYHVFCINRYNYATGLRKSTFQVSAPDPPATARTRFAVGAGSAPNPSYA